MPGVPFSTEVTPDIHEYEQHQVLERRRLNALPPTRSKHEATYLDICVREDPWIIAITREIKLELTQDGTHTSATIIRTLNLKYTDMRPGSNSSLSQTFTINTDAKSKMEYERAKKEAIEATGKHLHLGQETVEATLQKHNHYIERWERGIATDLWAGLHVYTSAEWPRTTPTDLEYCYRESPMATISWKIQMQEGCIALPDGAPGYRRHYEIPERTIEATRHTYEQIKSVMEWFFTTRGEKFQGRPLDRGTSNFLEPCQPGGKCGYCEEVHRTGDCLLPW